MEFDVSLDTSEARAAVNEIADAIRAGTGMQQGMMEAASYAEAFNRDRFLASSHGDGNWPDIAFSTKYERARKAAGGFKRTKGVSKISRIPDAPFAFPVLYVSGYLYTSLSPGQGGHWWLATADSVQTGTTVYYGRINHYGNGNHPPARPIMESPNEETREKMGGMIRANLEAVIDQVLVYY